MHILFCYLYRFTPHFTEYHEVVFSNTNQLPLAVIENIITTHLTAGSLFIPDAWQLPNLCVTSGYPATPPYHECVQVKALPATSTPAGDITLLLHTILLHAEVHKVL
jgi:hypothetical protein